MVLWSFPRGLLRVLNPPNPLSACFGDFSLYCRDIIIDVKNRMIVLVVFLLAVIGGIFALSFKSSQVSVQKDTVSQTTTTSEGPTSISIGQKRIKVLMAETEEEKELGLGGRDSLASDEGMLFAFGIPDTYSIWMKDMKFPIDVLWIDQDLRVVFVVENMKPESYPEIFTPSSPAAYVLEVPAGFSKENNVKIGTMVSF